LVRAISLRRGEPSLSCNAGRASVGRTWRVAARTIHTRPCGGSGWEDPMTYEERVVREEDPVDRGPAVVERRVTRTPSGGELAGRVVILIFGIIQVFIILRIVLLLLDAREGNGLVSFILNTSQIFVGPFEGMLKTNALSSGGSLLDVAAILALIGWTVLEALILAAVGIFRREPSV
jgi:hypothetical protein